MQRTLNADVLAQGSASSSLADWSASLAAAEAKGNTAGQGSAVAAGTGLSVAGVHVDGAVTGLESRALTRSH